LADLGLGDRVTRDCNAWRADWTAAETGHLRGEQREKYKQAGVELKAKVADLADELG
jgi:hypothetical protein